MDRADADRVVKIQRTRSDFHRACRSGYKYCSVFDVLLIPNLIHDSSLLSNPSYSGQSMSGECTPRYMPQGTCLRPAIVLIGSYAHTQPSLSSNWVLSMTQSRIYRLTAFR